MTIKEFYIYAEARFRDFARLNDDFSFKEWTVTGTYVLVHDKTKAELVLRRNFGRKASIQLLQMKATTNPLLKSNKDYDVSSTEQKGYFMDDLDGIKSVLDAFLSMIQDKESLEWFNTVSE